MEVWGYGEDSEWEKRSRYGSVRCYDIKRYEECDKCVWDFRAPMGGAVIYINKKEFRDPSIFAIRLQAALAAG
jgi:hypothetical protein